MAKKTDRPRPGGSGPSHGRPATGTEPAALERARKASRLMDQSIKLPVIGYRIGLDPILGILPVGGDSVAALASLYIVLEAVNLGAPPKTLLAMLALLAVDLVVGSVPVLGTVFDAVWKANTWNVRLLERHVERQAAER